MSNIQIYLLSTSIIGQPWIWARHDRKPSKSGDKRFAQYKKLAAKNSEEGKEQPEPFNWTPKDLKVVRFFKA